MSTFTKEQLIEKLQHRISVASGFPESEKAQIDLELARIALASLEAEAVADVVAWSSPNEERTCDVRLRRHDINPGPLYTSPPAPASAEPLAWLWSHRKHPSEVSLVRPEDDERAEGAHWSGWSCQALYAVPPAQVSVPDRSMFEKWWESEHGSPLDSWDSLRTTDGYCDDGIDGQFEAWNACRAAMLQGADGTLTNEGTIPVTQFKPVADLYGLTSSTGGETSFTFDAVEARDFIDGGWSCQEYVELERFQEAITNHTEDKLAMVDHSGDSNNMVEPVTTANELPFEQWLSQQTGTIDVECGCVMTEVFFHWLRVAYEAGNSPVIPDCSCRTCRPVTFSDSRFVVCPECGNKRCPHANDHRHACTGSNEPGQEGSAYPAAPQREVKP